MDERERDNYQYHGQYLKGIKGNQANTIYRLWGQKTSILKNSYTLNK